MIHRFMKRLNARKAKYGYRCDNFSIHDLEAAADIVRFLKQEPKDSYELEFMAKMGSMVTFAVYTNDDRIRDFLEEYVRWY